MTEAFVDTFMGRPVHQWIDLEGWITERLADRKGTLVEQIDRVVEHQRALAGLQARYSTSRFSEPKSLDAMFTVDPMLELRMHGIAQMEIAAHEKNQKAKSP